MGRLGHAACCINYGEQHPQLLVIGGVDKDDKTLRDAWLLDVDSGTWKEVCASSPFRCSLCVQFVYSYWMDCTVSWDMLINMSCQIIS